jgi:galactose-1-phosphate uridylyltransferase
VVLPFRLHKADILKMLRKHVLTDEQCARMRKVVAERVRGRAVRETRMYARFAPKVSTPQFEVEIRNIAETADRQAARHAQWVLDCLKSAGKKP